jgi:hypothetical protein
MALYAFSLSKELNGGHGTVAMTHAGRSSHGSVAMRKPSALITTHAWDMKSIVVVII